MAMAALMMAACSSDEIASVAQKGSAPLEIVPVVKTQTRAAQITMDNLTALTVDVTGTFVTADGNDVVNPVLTLAKSGSTWSYTYNGDNAGPLYWPNNAETATFSAHTLADGAAVNELTAQTDVVGDYTTKEFDGTNNPGAVALELKHAVSKMQFKARIQGEAADELKVKIDIKQVAVRAMNYAATYAKPAAAEATMGVLALGDSPAKADLTVASASAGTFITLNTTDATASTDLGHLFMVPQTVTAETLSESTWDDSYIAVYAQIRTVQGDVETMVFPTVGAVDETSYAWVAVPMPSDFTQMQAHHKYIFTINYSADALGKVDRNQEPVIPGGGEDIEIEGRSSQPVTVTVENVYDFEEEDVDVNALPSENIVDLGALDANYTANTNDVLTGTLAGQYQISVADGASVKLRDANISCLADGAAFAGITCLGNATISIEGTNTVVGGVASVVYDQTYYEGSYPGVFVPEGSTLTIEGATGTLNARCAYIDGTGDYSHNGLTAGIGGSRSDNCGNIVINSGTINAQGGCTGIGAGPGKTCGNITINGGTVTATGGDGAGIGSAAGSNDYHSVCGNISITGGTVVASGNRFSAGIGSGSGYSVCGNISITGGKVTARGGDYATGIGNGFYNGESNNECGTITIANTVTRVTAYAGSHGEYDTAPDAIGKGLDNAVCGAVTIGGTVYWDGSDFQNYGDYYIGKTYVVYPADYVSWNPEVWGASDFSLTTGQNLTKNGVTLTVNAGSVSYAASSYYTEFDGTDGGNSFTFSVPAGKKIVRIEMEGNFEAANLTGSGWSGHTWTGEASSVNLGPTVHAYPLVFTFYVVNAE